MAKTRARPAAPPAARAVALALVGQVLARSKPLDQVLAESRDLARLETRDRAFARLLVVTLLRRLGQVDAALALCLERPLAPAMARTRGILRLGAVQLLFLGTPAHAAVSESLALAETVGQGRAKGLINAVLRRIDQEGAGVLADQDAARLNTPDWLWQSWSETYGEETARAIAEAHLAEPPLDLSVKDDPAVWSARLSADVLPTGSLRLESGQGAVERLAGYEEGAWWVQDAAATLPARLLGDVKGLRVADLCAAPGGKTAQLAAAGAEVVAVERTRSRARRLEENLARLQLSAEVVVADARSWQPDRPFDAVLLDAPCSATGTLRRHPDIAWLKAPADLPPLVALQDALLDAAVAMLAPGGCLVYATCSLQPEEGPERVEALLSRRPGLSLVPVAAAELPGLSEAVTKEGYLRSLPCHWSARGGLDGFFAARLRRDA